MISTTDVSPLRVSTREETLGTKGNGGKHPLSLPGTAVTPLQSKPEGDNSSTGKDTGLSFPQSAKQCPRSSSMANPQSANIPSCVGFATASNKTILISEAALETAQRLVAASDGDGDHGNTSSSSKSAASDGMCCKTTADIRRKSGSYQRSAAVCGEVTIPGRISVDREGFKVASVKPVQVSDDVLKHFEDSFSIDISKRDVTSNKEAVSDSAEVTAASDAACDDNEDVDDVNTESRAGQHLIEDPSTPDKRLVTSVCVSTHAADVKNVAFQTSSNQQIDVSVNAVKIVETDSVFSDVVKPAQNLTVSRGHSVTTNVADQDDETTTRDRLRTATEISDTSISYVDVEFEGETLVSAIPETRKPSDVGLQRIGDKTLVLTEKNIRTNFFPNDVEDKVCVEKGGFAVARTDVSTKTGDFAGFRCASGKEILVTEESVKKARDIIDNDEAQNPVVCDVGREQPKEKLGGVNTSDNALGFAGFKCASGKGIRLSEPSIERARTFMSAIEEESGSRDVDKRIKNCFDDCVHAGGCDMIDIARCVARAADAGGCCKGVINHKMSLSASGIKSIDVCGGPTKDYSHLPKGFRPFKAPKSIVKKSLLHRKITDGSFNSELMETDAIETPKGMLEEQKGVTLKEISAGNPYVAIYESRVTSDDRMSDSKEPERSFTRESSPTSMHGFDDEAFDDLTYTQISEITDLTVACLQHQQEFEDGAFSQAPSPCKHRPDQVSNALGVIVEESIVGDIGCGVGKGGGDIEDMRLNPCDEEVMMAYEVVTSDTEHCGIVCDNGVILSEIDQDGKADITEERELAIMGLYRGRDNTVFGAPPAVHGKKVGVREKIAGRTDHLLGDISQLSEWDGDCSFSGSVVEDPLKTCGDGPSLAPLAVDDVLGLSPKWKSGAPNDGRMVSGVDNHHIPSSVGHEVMAPRSNNSTDGLPLSSASTICTGFTTARGIKVSVSDKALKESRKIFDDTEINSKVPENVKLSGKSPNETSTICTGFTTARGDKVSVSDKALKESRKIFDDTEIYSKTPEHVKSLDDGNFKSLGPPIKTASTICTGFTTAGGNKVSVSDKTLKDSRKTFDDTEINPIMSENDKLCVQSHIQSPNRASTICTGFTTARGIKVSVSEKALKESRKVFDDGELNSKDCTGEKSLTPEQTTNKRAERFTGFLTAGGSKVSVSHKALKASKKIFEDCETDCKDFEQKDISIPVLPLNTGVEHVSNVLVSDKALKYSREVFNDDECFMKDSTNTTLHKPSLNAPSSRFTGFSTARGDKVSVSEKALKESRKVFNDDECFVKDSTNTTLREPSTVASGSRFTGFATAKGDKVSVSEKALKESRKVFNDNNCFVNDTTNAALHEASPDAPGSCFTGFATARGDQVSVSEKALKESRKVFNDDEGFVKDSTYTTLHEPSPGAPGTRFTGFATARRDQVLVSEKALKDSRKVFNDDGCFVKDSTNTTLHGQSPSAAGTCFTGFATARGDKVSVSEKALKESRKMFIESKASIAEALELTDCENLELAGNAVWTSDRATEPDPTSLHPDVGYIVADTLKMPRDKEILKDRAQGTSVRSPFQSASGGEALTPVSDDVLIGVRCLMEDGNDDGGIVGKSSGFLRTNAACVSESDDRRVPVVKLKYSGIGSHLDPVIDTTRHRKSVIDKRRYCPDGSSRDTRKNIDLPSVDSLQDARATSECIIEEGENKSHTRRWSHRTSTPAVTDRSWKTATHGKII